MSRVHRMAGLLVIALLASACADLPAAAPRCDAADVLALMAQSVPTASRVPCLEDVPTGWSVQTFDVDDERAEFGLGHAVAGDGVVHVRLDEDCVDRDRRPLEPAPPTGSRTSRIEDHPDAYVGEWLLRSEGGCVSVLFDVGTPAWRDVVEELRRVLTTVDRAALAERLAEETDGRLRLDGPSSR